MQSANNGEDMLTALLAGSTAAAVSATSTFPFDSIKTQQQLNNAKMMLKFNVPGNFPGTLAQVFKGNSALVIGSVVKSSARIFSYNWSSKFMAIETSDAHGQYKQKTTAPRIVIAGLMSAFIETLWIIPFENIKINMIQNMSLNNEITRSKEKGSATDSIQLKHHRGASQNIFAIKYISPHSYYTSDIISLIKGHKPSSRFQPGIHSSKNSKSDALKMKYNTNPSMTLFENIKEIYLIKGIKGFTAGSFITMTRQIAISTVWLSTYSATRQLLDPHNKKDQGWFGHQHTTLQSIGLHLFASIAVVATTQPIDVVKTHIQSKNGKVIYKDSLSTAYRLVLGQGFGALFKGAAPRGIKILVSGGLTAGVYGYVESLVKAAGNQRIFNE